MAGWYGLRSQKCFISSSEQIALKQNKKGRMKMKKTIAFVLVVLLSFSLVSCGKDAKRISYETAEMGGMRILEMTKKYPPVFASTSGLNSYVNQEYGNAEIVKEQESLAVATEFLQDRVLLILDQYGGPVPPEYISFILSVAQEYPESCEYFKDVFDDIQRQYDASVAEDSYWITIDYDLINQCFPER